MVTLCFCGRNIDGYLLVARGLFIIDPNGVVRQVTINDLPVGRSVEETLRLVKAFQFVEKHGEGLLQKVTYFVLSKTVCTIYTRWAQKMTQLVFVSTSSNLHQI